MPLPNELQDKIIRYCDKDVPKFETAELYFDFISDQSLKIALAKEYVAARYIYKLAEAINVADEKLAAHAKFQIVQYASIFEAIIVHVLWKEFPNHPEVTKIEEFTSLKKSSSLPADIVLKTKTGEDIFLCVEKKQKNTIHSIKFQDKVSAAVKIGFIHPVLGEEIKDIYSLRNGVHIENAVSKAIEYEIDQAKLSYWRMRPFCIGVKSFLTSGTLPPEACPAAKGQLGKPLQNYP